MARRRRANRKPLTTAQRWRMIAIGGVLVFLACFAVLYEALAWESGNILALLVVVAVLFFVFILPILAAVRHARRIRRGTGHA